MYMYDIEIEAKKIIYSYQLLRPIRRKPAALKLKLTRVIAIARSNVMIESPCTARPVLVDRLALD